MFDDMLPKTRENRSFCYRDPRGGSGGGIPSDFVVSPHFRKRVLSEKHLSLYEKMIFLNFLFGNALFMYHFVHIMSYK